MLAATHMLAGATIYSLVKDKKLLGLTLAFCSHFLLDAIPHYDLNLQWNALIGVFPILFLAFIAWNSHDFYILGAAFLGALPDIISLLKMSSTFNTFHSLLHFNNAIGVSFFLVFIELFVSLLLAFFIKIKY